MATQTHDSQPTAARILEKAFFPLESDPELFTKLAHDLGLSSSLRFYDVFSLDNPDLLIEIPEPVYAFVLCYKVNDAYTKAKEEIDASMEDYVGSGEDEPTIWFRQTIRNACGLFGILHAASNGAVRKFVAQDSILGRILERAIPCDPAERALVLENDPDLERVHTAIALQGQTAPPERPDGRVEGHYTAFVKSSKNGRLYELNGGFKGPLELDVQLEEGDDLMSKPVLQFLRAYLQREQIIPNHSSLLALA